MNQTALQRKPVVGKSTIIRRSTDVSFDANQNKQNEPALMGSSLFRSAGNENMSEEQIRTSALFGSSCKPVIQSKEEKTSANESAENEVQKSEQEQAPEQKSIQAKTEAFTGKEDPKNKEDAFSGSTGLSSQIVNRSVDDSELKTSLDNTIAEDKQSLQKKEETSIEDNKIQLQSSETTFMEQKIQAKFTVGSADDHLEREADNTADKIVRMPEPVTDVENENKGTSIQKFSIFRKLLRKKAESDIPVVDEETASGIEMSHGMGKPLPENISSFMGKRFGADFSNVRIHTDSRASKISKKIRAQAFTIGNNIYFGESKFKPDTTDGKRLIAHELTHTIQQGSSPLKTGPAAVAPQKIQRDIIDDIKGSVANYIPGYKLITVILGKDPISGKAVPRTSENIINGLISLIPGGPEIFKNLQESGAIARAGQWLDQEINKLNITWDGIKALISQAWDQLSIWNSFGTNVQIVKNLFSPVYNRIKAFASAIGSKLKEFVMEGALSLAGGAGKQVLAILNKGQAVFSAIISNPIGFASNLIGSVRQGVNQFAKNFLTHFKKSILDWIFGTIAASGITLPKKFDVYGIFSLVMQILGLTYKNIRAKFVKEIGPKGEKVMSAVEKSVEILKDLVTKGPASLWDHVKEFVGNLTGTIIQKVSEWVAQTVVGQAIIKLVSMLSPVGALIQSAIAIYNTVMFFIERAQQIAQFVSSVLNSIGNIAMGQIGAAANYIENAMASGLTTIISFLARFIGLGNITEHIKKIIVAIRTPIDKALDKVVKTVVKKVSAIYEKMVAIANKGAAAVKSGVQAVKKFLFPAPSNFKAEKEDHKIYLEGDEKKPKIMVASENPKILEDFLEIRKTELIKVKAKTKNKKTLENIDKKLNAITSIKADCTRLHNQILQHNNVSQTFGEQIAEQQKKIALKMEGAGLLIKDAFEEKEITFPPSNVEFGSLHTISIPFGKNIYESQFATSMTAKILSIKPGNTTGSAPQDPRPEIYEPMRKKKINGKRYNVSGKMVLGHLLNDNLMGPGTPENLSPITKKANSDHKNHVENKLKDAIISEGKVFEYKVDVNYGNGGPSDDPFSYLANQYVCNAKELEVKESAFVKNDTPGSQPGDWEIKKKDPIKISYIIENRNEDALE